MKKFRPEKTAHDGNPRTIKLNSQISLTYKGKKRINKDKKSLQFGIFWDALENFTAYGIKTFTKT